MVQKQSTARPRSAFIICDPGSDIRPLTKVLHDLGVRTLNAEDALAPSKDVVNSTLGLIGRADLVCAVLEPHSRSAEHEQRINVLFELGFAIGAKLPIVLIGDPSELPSDLAPAFAIRAPISDTAALLFQLRAFLDNLKRKNRRTDRARPMRPKRPSRGENKLVKTPGLASELENQLLKALQLSPEISSIVVRPRVEAIGASPARYVPDLAIWFTAAPETIGNQAIIELKGSRLLDPEIERAVEQIRVYAQAADIRTGLVLTESAMPSRRPVLSLSPLVFGYSLSDFYKILRAKKLVETLRRERNRFAHSAG
jgi:hypothetical protein